MEKAFSRIYGYLTILTGVEKDQKYKNSVFFTLKLRILKYALWS